MASSWGVSSSGRSEWGVAQTSNTCPSGHYHGARLFHPDTLFHETAMSLLFTPYELSSARASLALSNRLVIAPMCQYSAVDGLANDWHLTHWVNMLNAGAGMFIIEATAVSPSGRISPGCLGLWSEAHAAAFQNHLHRARQLAPAVPVCLQLAHAGRKGSSAEPWNGGMQIAIADGGWVCQAPSAVAHSANEQAPEAMSLADIAELREAFKRSATYAAQAGVDALELHGAHGYLLHQFLSPLANQRDDAYGGDWEGRTRLLRELFADVCTVFPGPVGVRLSATDWVEGGWTPEETVRLSQWLKDAGAAYIHISTAGVSPLQKIPVAPGFQLPFAQQVKDATGLTTIGVGMITEPEQAERALQDGQTDLIAIARAALFNPRWGWAAAAALGGQVASSPQYQRALPAAARGIFGDFRFGMR